MGAPPPSSQAVPLPADLPFRLVSKTIGAGAYASVRKATLPNRSSPVFAIKFINKQHALRVGRLQPKQIELEISLHHRCSGHVNIIKYIQTGEDQHWHWIAMELADGGDLFDKIEADEGVPEEIAHFYFKQLVNAITWCHSKGVAHRDIKPENMLLTGNGDLKLADFGLATMYMNAVDGTKRPCTTVCGSPPYAAPEIFRVGEHNDKLRRGEISGHKMSYKADLTDFWSCAVVLFVLLVGNTPWDVPDARRSHEFGHFLDTNGRPEDDELWQAIPSHAMSLIRGMLNVDPEARFTLKEIRSHPWFSARNKYMNEQGGSTNPVMMATVMMERLLIELDGRTLQTTAMQLDTPVMGISSTQPTDLDTTGPMEWEAPPRLTRYGALSASQPVVGSRNDQASSFDTSDDDFSTQMSQDPTMSQFSQQPRMNPTLTQLARKFNDIAPAHALTRFYSRMLATELLALIQSTLHTLNVLFVEHGAGGDESGPGSLRARSMRVKAIDTRKQPLNGNVFLDSFAIGNASNGRADSVTQFQQRVVTEVRFVKERGDPLEWRRMFKRVVQMCGHAVCRP